jgi:F0F1-type ATP synthase membrane subunit b/b'
MNLNPLTQIDLFVIGATVVVFVVTYFVLRHVFADKIVAIMEERRTRCEAADDACQQAQALLAQAEAEAAELADKTSEEAEGLIQFAREQAQTEKGRTIGDARERTEARLRAGREEIEEEKGREVSRVRAEAIECVGLACEKVAGEVDSEIVTATVDRVVARTIQ